MIAWLRAMREEQHEQSARDDSSYEQPQAHRVSPTCPRGSEGNTEEYAYELSGLELEFIDSK